MLGLTEATHTVESWRAVIAGLLAAGAFPQDKIDAYFTRHHERFDLFSADRPWRQDPRLVAETTGPVGLNTLIASRPAGNNATLFSPFHEGSTGVATIQEAVESLLIVQIYGPLGRCQSRQAVGMPTPSANFTYVGASRSRVSYFSLGRTVFETLIANLVNPSDVKIYPLTQPYLPDWERDTLPNPIGRKPKPTGIVGLLAADGAHAVLLKPGVAADGEIVVTDAWLTWQYNDKTGGNLIGCDPYFSYRMDKDRIVTQQADASRVVWRDLPALLDVPIQQGKQNPYQQPFVFSTLRTYVKPLLPYLRVGVFGFVQHGFQAVNEDWYAAITPAVLEKLDTTDPDQERYRKAIQAWVAAAETESRILRDHLTKALVAARQLDPKSDAAGQWSRRAQPTFWARASTLFEGILGTLEVDAFEKAAEDAPATLRMLTLEIYDQTTDALRDARGIQAVVRYRPRNLRSAA